MGHNSVMRKLSYKPRSFFHWKFFLGRLAYIQKQHCKYQDKIKVLDLHDRQCKLKLTLISVCFTEMPALSKKILGMCNAHLSIICTVYSEENLRIFNLSLPFLVRKHTVNMNFPNAWKFFPLYNWQKSHMQKISTIWQFLLWHIMFCSYCKAIIKKNMYCFFNQAMKLLNQHLAITVATLQVRAWRWP